MFCEINGREYKVRSVKMLTYKKFKKRTGITLILTPSNSEPFRHQQIKSLVVGFCKTTSSVLVEPRMTNYKGRKWDGIHTDKTRREQLSHLSDEELAQYVTAQNTRMKLERKNLLIEFSLDKWIQVTGYDNSFVGLAHDDDIASDLLDVLYHAKKPLSAEELSDEVGCLCDVAKFHLDEFLSIKWVVLTPILQTIYAELTPDARENIAKILAPCELKNF